MIFRLFVLSILFLSINLIPSYGQDAEEATIKVIVNADTKIWFDDYPTTSTGHERMFKTPALEPNKQYTYEVKAMWVENGQTIERYQTVVAKAGYCSVISFLSSQPN